MDVLADLLSRARAQGGLFAHTTLHTPWGLELQDPVPLSVHAVLDGELWLEMDGEPPVELRAGDLALVHSPAAPYRFTDVPGGPARPLAEVAGAWAVPGAARRFVSPGGGAATIVACGAYGFGGSVCDGLLAALPPLVVVRDGDGDESLRSALALFATELAHERPGQQVVLDRLLDVLLVAALRWHLGRPGVARPRWYAALGDPEVGRSLALLHGNPAGHWTVAGLAAAVGLSRAAFARRFSRALGQPPLLYLAQWRMALAREALLEPGATLARVAEQVGYSSEFSFAAAFKRANGVAPGRWRREQSELRLHRRDAADGHEGSRQGSLPPG